MWMRPRIAVVVWLVALLFGSLPASAQRAQADVPLMVADSGDLWPELPPSPSEYRLVKDRLTVLCPRMTADVAKVEEVKKLNSLWDVLLLDRIAGTYSVGEGLTAQINATGADVTVVRSERRFDSWTVNYTVPLSVLRQKWKVDRQVQRDVDVMLAKQDIEALSEAASLRLSRNQYQINTSVFERLHCQRPKESNIKTCRSLFQSSIKIYDEMIGKIQGAEQVEQYCDLTLVERFLELTGVDTP